MRHSNLARRPSGKVETKSFALKGGLNLVDAPLEMPPGMFLDAINYEPMTRPGYERTKGHERFDGRPKPSDANYWILDFDAGNTVSADAGGYCTGLTSGATGLVGAVVLESGTWAGGDAAGYIALYTLTGTFQDNEALSFTGAGDGFSTGFSSGFG